jgi:hypothetical protein
MQTSEKQSKKQSSPTGSLHALLPAALSMLLPGAGHLLIGRWGRAAIWFAGWILVVGASGSSHNPAVFALMAVSAVDAYAFARGDARAAAGARDGSGGEA